MRVSVVTPCYNAAPFIKAALDSIFSCNYRDLEVIVVDAGSSDGSLRILQQYEPRLAALIAEPDDGPADALNKGFAVATGELFGYLNADDMYAPTALRQAAMLFAQQSRSVIYGNGWITDANGVPQRKFVSRRFTPRRYVYGAAVVMQQATFFSADAFRRSKGFNIENRTCWDGELLVDLALQGEEFRRVKNDWGRFRLHADSISGSGRLNDQYRSDRKRIFEKVMQRPPRVFDNVGIAIGRAVGKFGL